MFLFERLIIILKGMEHKITLYIITLFALITSCNTELDKQEINTTKKIEFEAIDTIITETEKDLFEKGPCKEYSDEDNFTFTDICYYPNAKNFDDLYRIFLNEYSKNKNHSTKPTDNLPVKNDTITGEYPLSITYELPKTDSDSLIINLFYPGGEDYYYFYSRNDSSFVQHIASPD
jgi:hypothetical protein